MKHYFIVVLGILSFSIFGCTSKSKTEAEKSGMEAAQAWLEYVDSEKYTESWNEAAEYFKTAVTLEKWIKSMEIVRTPLGKIISRNLKSKKYITSLPGSPDGEYVLIQYKTTFEYKKTAVEKVSTMLDKDGTWRVAGYFIK